MKRICISLICIIFLSGLTGCDSSLNTEAQERRNATLINTVYYGYLLDYNVDSVPVGTFLEDLFDDCSWLVREEGGNDLVLCNAKIKSTNLIVRFVFKVIENGRFVLVSVSDGENTVTKQSEIKQVITTLHFQWAALKMMGK